MWFRTPAIRRSYKNQKYSSFNAMRAAAYDWRVFPADVKNSYCPGNNKYVRKRPLRSRSMNVAELQVSYQPDANVNYTAMRGNDTYGIGVLEKLPNVVVTFEFSMQPMSCVESNCRLFNFHDWKKIEIIDERMRIELICQQLMSLHENEIRTLACKQHACVGGAWKLNSCEAYSIFNWIDRQGKNRRKRSAPFECIQILYSNMSGKWFSTNWVSTTKIGIISLNYCF